ncbi:MAG: response regulator receiver protein [Acidobacteriaceae bacterium]|nr:response regulator receiver protein [Acidobacteriaceae bacterium]
MKRRILLVDDEVAVLLTMKAVLEISGFDVETAASAREGKLRLRSHEYHMVITDMRMENDEAGREVIRAARTAAYHPAVALLTAFPVDEADWQELGAHQLLLKPMHTRLMLQQIEKLFDARDQRLAGLDIATDPVSATPAKKASAKKSAVKTASAKTKASAKKSAAAKVPTAKSPLKSAKAKKTAAAAKPAKKPASKRSSR